MSGLTQGFNTFVKPVLAGAIRPYLEKATILGAPVGRVIDYISPFIPGAGQLQELLHKREGGDEVHDEDSLATVNRKRRKRD